MISGMNDCGFGSSGNPAERRHGGDVSPGLRAHLFPDYSDAEKSDQLDVVSLSLSHHGIAMELGRDVPVGAIYNLQIDGNQGKAQSQVRIVSCDPIADGLYRAGGEFCQNELRPGN